MAHKVCCNTPAAKFRLETGVLIEVWRNIITLAEIDCFSVASALFLNPLECKGSSSATSNSMKLVYWPLMGGLLHFVQRGGDWARPQPAQGADSQKFISQT